MKYNVDSIIGCGKVLQREDFVFFWGHVARAEKQMKACLSQWFPCSFLVDDIYYNCAEQFMMAEKARLFHDEDALQTIMQAYDPMELIISLSRYHHITDTVPCSSLTRYRPYHPDGTRYHQNDMSVVKECPSPVVNLVHFSADKEGICEWMSTSFFSATAPRG